MRAPGAPEPDKITVKTNSYEIHLEIIDVANRNFLLLIACILFINAVALGKIAYSA